MVWGSCKPMREFLYIDDIADACLFLMKSHVSEEWFNVGKGEDVTIRELAETLMSVVGSEGNIVFDESKPDGRSCKLLNVERMQQFGLQAQLPLRRDCQGLCGFFC